MSLNFTYRNRTELQNHFAKVQQGSSEFSKDDVRFSLEKEAETFYAKYHELRNGNKEKNVLPKNISIDEFAKDYFNADARTLLKAFGVSFDNTFETAAKQMGFGANINVASFVNLMNNYSGLSGLSFANNPSNTGDFKGMHFLLPEIILQAINLGLNYRPLSRNWIATTQSVRARDVVMPYIKEADAMPMEVEEGGDIPLGETSFGQKTVKVRKIGRGLQITDELLYESTIDFFSVFLRHFGIKLSIGKDMRALLTLINGDQDDLSEAAPVIGVENSGAFEMLDIDRVTTRMEALQQPYTSAVMKESIFNTDLNAALTSRERMTVKQYLPNSTTHEGMPANAILFVNRETALAELQYRGLTTETHRNPAKQTNTLYVSTSVGYGKIMQTGAVLLTSAGEFSSANFKFPSSMDLEYLVSQDFKK